MNEIKKITSFTVDHTKLREGMYISRVDGDVTTFDLRTRVPNAGDYMDHATMHTLEHLFATYIRNSEIGAFVIYFGPMGCQTGFYLLVRSQNHAENFEAVKAVLRRIINHDGGMFGAERKECGNYRNLDIESAKKECQAYLEALEAIGTPTFKYPTE